MASVDLAVSVFPLQTEGMDSMRRWLLEATCRVLGARAHEADLLVDAAVHVLEAAAAFGPRGRLVTLAVALQEGSASISMTPGGGPGGGVTLRQRVHEPAPCHRLRVRTPGGGTGRLPAWWRPMRAEA